MPFLYAALVALAVHPLRIVDAGFAPFNPARDCADDASTEAAQADAVRRAGGGYCNPPFNAGGAEVCADPTSQRECSGSFVPLDPGGASSVDTIPGRITRADPLGTLRARTDSPVLADRSTVFIFIGAIRVLDCASANDSLDGMALGGPEVQQAAVLVGSTGASGSPGDASEPKSVSAALRNFVLQG